MGTELSVFEPLNVYCIPETHWKYSEFKTWLLLVCFAKHSDMMLTLKVPNKNCSRWHFNFYFYLSKKIRLDFHVNPLLGRGFTWNTKFYFLWKIMKNYLWISSAAFLIGALRVNLFLTEHIGSSIQWKFVVNQFAANLHLDDSECCWRLALKQSYTRKKSQSLSFHVVYFCIFLNWNSFSYRWGAPVAQWVKRCPTDLADQVRSLLVAKSSQP